MFKIAGVLMIVSCGGALAYWLNHRARMALMQTEGFIDLVRYLRSEIDCFSMPIPTALERCPDTIFQKCGAQRFRGARTVSELLDACEILSPEISEAMQRFAADVGRGYKHEQLSLCDRTAELLEGYRNLLAEQLPVKRKLNGTLCLCSALVIVILLL